MILSFSHRMEIADIFLEHDNTVCCQSGGIGIIEKRKRFHLPEDTQDMLVHPPVLVSIYDLLVNLSSKLYPLYTPSLFPDIDHLLFIVTEDEDFK